MNEGKNKTEEDESKAPDPEISVEAAKNLIRDDDRTVVIDMRSSREIALGYIKGARFVPLGLIEGESNKLSADREAPVLVYCAVGTRSLEAVDKLRAMGFSNAHSIAGGYSAWLNEDGDIVSDGQLTLHQMNRYSRNMLLKEIGEEGQLKLLAAKVLIVGAGGLASSAALYLAAGGVGTLGIMDFDRVDMSNLNRQIIHRTEDVHRLKVESAKEAIERINPDVKVISFPERLTPANALAILEGFDIVMDATDNLETKFLLNDACYFTGKPYIFGGAVGFDGQASVFWSKQGGPCLRCIFPKPPPRHLVPT
jgi:sulfur-carrier protein adenylyltransferase/sulfurtransferase